MRVLDAETLAAQHLMPQDQAMRERDLPERFQLAGVVHDEAEVGVGWRGGKGGGGG